jgi:hypothetical protein
LRSASKGGGTEQSKLKIEKIVFNYGSAETLLTALLLRNLIE